MFNLTPATQEEHDSLVEKCPEERWLKRGGFDWQDDRGSKSIHTTSPAHPRSKTSPTSSQTVTGQSAKACSSVTLPSSSRSTGATNGGR